MSVVDLSMIPNYGIFTCEMDEKKKELYKRKQRCANSRILSFLHKDLL